MHCFAPPFRIAIVGMGSRGLSVLEQLIGLAREASGLRLRIDVFDPRAPGSGLHHAQQPDYLMLNTMAGQLTAFSTRYPSCESPGMTFLQWCDASRVRLDERGHVTESHGRPVAYGDFVPRKLLGRYLQACYRMLVRHCPAHVQVQHHAEAVTQCRPLADRPGFGLVTASGWQQACDGLFLTAGHAPQPAAPDNLGQRVAIEGLGLTAMDALAHLTEGRGGRFVPDRCFAGWRYQPSGREPQLFMYSRSGLPFHARPRWQPGGCEAFPRLYFTAAAIDALRCGRHSGRLDFRADVLPLIDAEMRAVFYQAKVRLAAPRQLGHLQQQMRQAQTPEKRTTLFARLAEQWDDFEPQDWLTVAPWTGPQGQYANGFRRWIERDLALSRLGTAQSPLKQALEVWRDYRDLLRRVADGNGLTDRSTHEFYAVWAGVSNRLVGGPQHERYEDLLALLDAGIVTLLPPGAEPALSVDSVITARVAHGHAGLTGDLLEQGLIRAAHPYPADGIETDALGRAVLQDGSVQQRLWVLGPAVEGWLFYNHYVPTPDPACLAPTQARVAAQSCLDSLTASLARRHCA
ncbi:FAD-NAD(P)-binding domain protein [Pseudomonas sp. v388]|uniref:FAD/NAD(P)-binding protein n=1 Tax=Pseudomonas sp. v388 TaxID=2479849 RepID=UPI000F7B2269|nr:FAD/NAD(P)-binding domain-containing protein [Pseudomonas sp. v388]RRV10840.1 FAD-NAD(P)-binding domain protein [Pseudomonas sp. v388]